MHTVSFVVNLVIGLLNAICVVVIINSVLSWFRLDQSNPILDFIDRVSETVCAPVRRLFPTVIGGFDLAPLIVIVVLQLITNVIRDLAGRWMY